MNGLGERLKKEREMRGVSLDEIAKATRIHKKFLSALEENDFDALPAPVFVAGFLRSYASHLGLDADSLVADYDKVKKPLKNYQPLAPEESKLPLISKEGMNRNFPLIAAGAVILLLGGLLAVFVMRSQAPRGETPAVQKPEEEDLLAQTAETPPAPPPVAAEQPPAEMPAKAHETAAVKTPEPVAVKPVEKPADKPAVTKPEPAKPVDKPAAAKPEAAKPAEKPAEKPKPEAAQESAQKSNYKYSLNLSAVDQDVWVYVLIDETDVRDMYVRAGQTVFLRGNQSFVLTTGNSYYLKVKVNGTAVEIPSASSNKVVRNWPVPLPG